MTKDTAKKYSSKKALVVDDDVDFIQQTEIFLSSLGFETLRAECQKDAEAMIEQGGYDLAVFDLMMENHDSGFVLCYKSKKKHPQVPVILVTAVTSETGFRFDTATGDSRNWIRADAILDKAIRHEQLRKEIDRLLKE